MFLSHTDVSLSPKSNEKCPQVKIVIIIIIKAGSDICTLIDTAAFSLIAKRSRSNPSIHKQMNG